MLYLFNIPIAAWAGVGKGECMSAYPLPSVWNLWFQVSGTLDSRYLELGVPGIGTGWF